MLFHRVVEGVLEVLLVHPGGPFFARKDAGVWSIPKGEPAPGEALLACALREVTEELGFAPPALPEAPEAYVALGECRQAGGKVVHAWACRAEVPLPLPSSGRSTAELEWPPRSGKRQRFPEVDDARYFTLDVAHEKINPAQRVFLDRLRESAPS